LNELSLPALCILSIGVIRLGISGSPIIFALKTILQSSSWTTAPLSRKIMNFVLLVLTAILLERNQFAIFLSSIFTKVQISFRFFPFKRQVVSSAKLSVSIGSLKEKRSIQFNLCTGYILEEFKIQDCYFKRSTENFPFLYSGGIYF
jgi:hypothetical protein